MVENIKNSEVSMVNSSLSENDYKLFSELTNLIVPDSMKKSVSDNPRLSLLVKTHFKDANERILNNYSKHGINMTSLQQSLVNYNYDLGDFGVKKDGVDGYFGKNTFVAIINLQKSLGQKPTGVADLKLLRYLFPYKFRTRNKEKDGKNPKEIKQHVLERTIGYEELLNEKREIIESSKTEIQKIKSIKATEQKKHMNQPQSTKKIIKAELNKKYIIKGIPYTLSLPSEKKGDMTYCSRTARQNLARLGIKKGLPRGSSAISTLKKYGNRKNYVNKISEGLNKANVLDLFVDSKSKYEHRASAYMNNGNWYVLDPYSKLPSNEKDERLPIPLNEYLSAKKLLGVFPYIV